MSRKHRQPLAGNNYYAQKFLEFEAKGVLLANDLQQQLANSDNKEVQGSADEIASLLTTFFTPDLDSKERTEIRKKISFLYKRSIEPALSIAPPHIPKGKLFPLEILQGTRDYIERIGQQANGCYEQGWYDACAVMLRRPLETLIIECYEHHKIDGTIKGGDGNFLQLRERQTRARRPRHVRGFSAKLVSIVGCWLHFAWRVGRGRRATAFHDTLSISK